LAEPGGKFEATDVITNERLPRQRLIFAGLSQKYCIVHYERGGIALSPVVAFFDISNHDAKVLWISNTSSKTLPDLKVAFESGTLSNDLGRTVW
jgi:hypothetical protein